MVNGRKRRIILILGSVFAVLVLVVAIAHLEPFAPRYQGRTVDEWLAFYAENKEEPEKAVIRSFGTNALPTLLTAKEAPFWLRTAIQFSRLTHASKFAAPLERSAQKIVIARLWGRHFVEVDPQWETKLLKNNPDDEYVSEVFDLTYDVAASVNRLSLYLTNEDEAVRKRAARLLQKATARSLRQILKMAP
jgi:hypothetical protein